MASVQCPIGIGIIRVNGWATTGVLPAKSDKSRYVVRECPRDVETRSLAASRDGTLGERSRIRDATNRLRRSEAWRFRERVIRSGTAIGAVPHDAWRDVADYAIQERSEASTLGHVHSTQSPNSAKTIYKHIFNRVVEVQDSRCGSPALA